ncbi:MAG TPA: TIGR03086 family metal-binding protein [Acidimicrobiia bacterium]|nr:TIGR03086 family metal-binding protein [Acidimicrobiia bacterium]
MSEIADRYETIADGFGDRVAGIDAGGWAASSPCDEWQAQDVVVHVINVHRQVLAGLDGSQPSLISVDDDLAPAWADATASVRGALHDPDRAGHVVSGGPFGEQPFESLVGRVVCADTLVHTWDLARATGQDERLDPAAVEKAAEFLVPLDDNMRRPGGFAAKVEPAAGADAQTRLLNFSGRAV